MNYLGADPGASGALVLISSERAVLGEIRADVAITDLLEGLQGFHTHGPLLGVLEKVSAFTGQGAQASFKFGENYGILRCALVAAGIPLRRVSPGMWQREFNLPSLTKAGSKTAKKNEHKARAQELFPRVSVIHANADALLMAEWLRRKNQTPDKPRPVATFDPEQAASILLGPGESL